MKTKSIFLQKLCLAVSTALTLTVLSVGTVAAIPGNPGPPPPPPQPSPSNNPTPTPSNNATLDTDTCKSTKATECVQNPNGDKCSIDKEDVCNPVKDYLNPFINVLTLLAGIGITAGIIWGGIQYSMSAGDPQKAGTAKSHIRNSVVALLALLFFYAFLKFLLPGGNVITG